MMRRTEAYEERLSTAPMSHFVEEVGYFFDRFGFRRNLGRIWATLYLAPDPLSQNDLVELCDLSVGMVSSSLRELEHWGAVRQVSVRGEKVTLWQAEDRLLRTVASILAKRELEAVRRLRQAADDLRAHGPAPGKKLGERMRAVVHVADLYEVLATIIGRMADLPLGVIEQTARAVRLAKFLDKTASRVARKSR